MHSDEKPGIGRSRWVVFAVIALIAVLIRIPGFGDPFHDYDEQLYHLVGLEMLKGHMPYVDVWDRKPFGLFALFALAALASGGSVIGYQVVAAAAAAIGACQTYVIGRRFGDSFACLFAAVLYLVCFPLFTAPSAQSEVFYIPLLLGMLQLTLRACDSDLVGDTRKAALWAMVLGGIALQIKYTVLPQCLFLGMVLLWRLHRLGLSPVKLVKSALAFAALGLAPTIAVATGYALAGHFNEFFYANFLSIFTRGVLHGPIADTQWRWIVYGSSWLWFAAAVGLLLVATKTHKVQRGYWLTGMFVLASLASMLMVGNTYIHYFLPIVPGLLLLAVPAYSHRPLCRFLALLSAFLAIGFSHYDAYIERGNINRAALPLLTAAVRPYVNQTDRCLYIFDGPPALYEATNSCLPTRFVFPDHLNSGLETNSIGASQTDELRRIFAARPGAIVTRTNNKLPKANLEAAQIVAQELGQNYTRTLYFAPRRLEVFVRRDLLVNAGAKRQSAPE